MKKVVMFLCCLTLLFSGCGHKRTAETVREESLPVQISADANLAALHMATITPLVSGKIISPPLKVGQVVQEGELLIEVDTTLYDEQIHQAAQALANRQSQGVVQKTMPVNAEAKALYDMGALSRVEYEKRVGQTVSVGVPRGNDSALQDVIARAQASKAQCKIVAPISGIISAVMIEQPIALVGQPLVTIRRESPIVASFAVPEKYGALLRKAKANKTLKVELIGKTEKESGELTYIGEEAELYTGTFLGKAVFENINKKFTIGSFYKINLTTEEQAVVRTIHKSAIQEKEGSTFVYLLRNDNILDIRPVVIGSYVGDRAVILSGISVGDRVMTGDTRDLAIGMQMKLP